MTLDIRLFPCRSDNYGFLIRDRATGAVATVDTPDAEAILNDLQASGWGTLGLILNTHWHPDHTEGNARLQAETGCEIVGPEEVRRVAPLDRAVGDGDQVTLGETTFAVTATPGHTLGHIVYRAGVEAFVGDTIFALGCGRLFEGTPDQMWASLQRLMAWPDETRLWCAHEYTASNARFALSLDDGPEMTAHAQAIFAARERGEPTVPTTMAVERRLNPFLTAGDASVFGQRRAAKDGFAG
ncbi:MAG: hydroxyacylglutathione hydrolase [Brevundimonas sp.]|nr:MAG: hydroxyacylglutathione hydrolase [Brevundimonas sp.]